MIVGVCSDAVTLCLKQSPRMEGLLKPPRLVQRSASPIETAGCQWPIVAGGFPSQSRVSPPGAGALHYHCITAFSYSIYHSKHWHWVCQI